LLQRPRTRGCQQEDEIGVNCGRIAALVTKIQNVFLDAPGLTMTLAQPQKRVGTDEITSEAVLRALVGSPVHSRPGGQPCRGHYGEAVKRTCGSVTPPVVIDWLPANLVTPAFGSN
jgi:hypothetical protein